MLLNRKKAGFTLVELMVTITIIGILTAIVFSSFDSARQKARDNDRIADLGLVEGALEQFAIKYGRYPSLADGSCSFEESFDPNTGCLKVLVSEGIINELPTDPLHSTYSGQPHSDRMYFYDNWCSGIGVNDNQYRMWANGERNQVATEHDWWNDNTIGITNCTDPS